MGSTARRSTPEPPVDVASIAGKTIAAGQWALGELIARMEKRLAEENPERPVTDVELWRVVDAGAKMAGVVARSKVTLAPEDLSGFIAGKNGTPSPRFGTTRMRVIEGEARAVLDYGRADRKRYNRRARQEGGPVLPE